MNYAAHYDRLIERARYRVLEGYRERHHVMPKCMGGGNEPSNIVELTGEEHYVAHQLLTKMHPEVPGLAIATVRMAKQCAGSRAYGWLRRRAAIAASKQQSGKPKSPEHVAKVAAAQRGKKQRPHTLEERMKQSTAQRGKKRAPFSAEHRAKISASKRGNKNSVGRIVSQESRAKMRVAKLGKSQSKETIEKRSTALRGHVVSFGAREKISAANRGRVLSSEQRKKIGIAGRGRACSMETRAKLSAALLGMKKPPRTAEWRAKQSAAQRGKVAPQETRDRIANALRGIPKTAEHRAKVMDALQAHYASKVNADTASDARLI